MPASIAANDLLVMIMRTPLGTMTLDSGDVTTRWTALVSADATDASDDKTWIFYRWADGGEGADESAIVSPSSKLVAITWRITGAQNPVTQAPELSTIATGTSAVPNPTTVTPTGGLKDYLFLWLGAWEGEQTSPPASNPTSYVNPVGADTGIGGAVATNCRAAGASRALTAASEDPGSWTISVSDDWTAWAMAIHPDAPAITRPPLPTIQQYAVTRSYHI